MRAMIAAWHFGYGSVVLRAASRKSRGGGSAGSRFAIPDSREAYNRRRLPTVDHAVTEAEHDIMTRDWFYRFELPDGRVTPTYDDGALDAVHATRLAMLEGVLDAQFGPSLARRSAVDLACHQGWFATKLAERGADVLGVDARASHVADASLIRDAMQLDNLRLLQSDVHALSPDALGTFDVVLMLGLIYHLENPVGALRLARALTAPGGVCLVETQIVPGLTGVVDYGSYRFVRPLKGSFGIIDETGETHGPEASTTGICLVPSLEALFWILRKIGFARVEQVAVPEDGYEQLRYGKRAMVACFVDDQPSPPAPAGGGAGS